MQEPHGEGPASHTDPESCVGSREAVGEALTGERTDQVLSCEITASRVPTPLCEAEGNTESGVSGEPEGGPGAVEDPVYVRTLRAREPGDPAGARPGWWGGTAGEGQQPYARHGRLREVGRSRSTGEAAEQ
jgi:hypothetical protein